MQVKAETKETEQALEPNSDMKQIIMQGILE